MVIDVLIWPAQHDSNVRPTVVANYFPKVPNSPPPDPHGHPSLRATALIKVANLADNSHNKHH